MDSSRPQRELVFCHRCESEWYRDQGGLSCPECHSEFVEVIEADHDPRQVNPPQVPPRPDMAPDPEEEDISDTGWQRGPHGGMTFHYSSSGNGRSQSTPAPNLLDSFSSMFGSILGGRPPPPEWQHQHHGEPQQSTGYPPFQQTQTRGNQRYNTFQDSNTTVRSGGGPGFSWRVTTSHGGTPSMTGQGDGQVPFPLRMLFGPNVMVTNAGRGPSPFTTHPGQIHDQPFGPMDPFAQLFGILTNPAMARGGDAVYTQEALDRVISQLMEQNATGNAPGPATTDAIRSLPKRKITVKDLGEEQKAECSICMDEVNIGQEVTELPCHHWFHEDCVKAWLQEHDTCPHCRQGIMPKEEQGRSRAPGEAPRHDVMWGQGQGTQADPWVVPGSPERSRHGPIHQGHGSGSAASTSTQNNEGLFARMRSAFGSGGGSGNGSGTGGEQ